MRLVKLMGVSTCLALWVGPLSVTTLAANSAPDRAALRQHVARGNDIAAAINGNLHRASPATPNSGSICKAERSQTGNVQVNCRAEDGSAIFSQQNETTISAFGSKVVVGFNDDLVCCSTLNFSGYSVSTNGGRTFTDRGDVPWSPNVQPLGDPSLSHDDEGNFYYASLALDLSVPTADSLIVLYEMPARSNSFRRLSVPVNVGDSSVNFADKDLLEVGQDRDGNRHFYITWTFYTNNSFNQGTVMLTDSVDGVQWRTTQVSPGITCQPLSPASHPLPAGNTVYVSYIEMDMATCTTDAKATKGRQTMVTVDVTRGQVTAVRTIAGVKGAGDVVEFCGQGWLQVIQTFPGQNIRSPELPSSAIDQNGTLYDVWSDRPAGPGGDNGNASRIFLSYSLDRNASWSVPQVISGPASPNFMNDRFQPWLTADEDGLHAIWYERLKAPHGGPDWLRTDKIDLSPATTKRAPRSINGGETVLSSVPFPVIDTGGGCYMGDYNQIASNGHRRFVSWGDNRNTVTTPAGPANQPDVFSQSYGAEND